MCNLCKVCVTWTDLSKTIEVNSWPWPKEAGEEKIYNSAAFASVLLIGMAFSYIPGGMSVDPVKDREVSKLPSFVLLLKVMLL
jgi:hypothetical protein